MTNITYPRTAALGFINGLPWFVNAALGAIVVERKVVERVANVATRVAAAGGSIEIHHGHAACLPDLHVPGEVLDLPTLGKLDLSEDWRVLRIATQSFDFLVFFVSNEHGIRKLHVRKVESGAEPSAEMFRFRDSRDSGYAVSFSGGGAESPEVRDAMAGFQFFCWSHSSLEHVDFVLADI